MDPHHVLESSESYKRFIVSPFDRAAFLSVLFFIVVLFFIQTTVIIRLTSGLLQVDLLTPFIVLLGIYHSNTKSCFFTTITALFLEAQGSLPGGFFLSSYWMICLFILLTRQDLTWNRRITWLSSMVVALSLVFLYKYILTILISGSVLLLPSFLTELFPSLCCVCIGSFLINVPKAIKF